MHLCCFSAKLPAFIFGNYSSESSQRQQSQDYLPGYGQHKADPGEVAGKNGGESPVSGALPDILKGQELGQGAHSRQEPMYQVMHLLMPHWRESFSHQGPSAIICNGVCLWVRMMVAVFG